MTQIDWSVLSGPRVSRRTLLSVAAAAGAAGQASRFEQASAAMRPVTWSNRLVAQGEP